MIFIAIGANLPGADHTTPRDNCEHALELLTKEGVKIVDRSRWYRSPAWPPSDQPDFVNGVARLEARCTPEALLATLHAIEARMGRVRGERNMARVIDLDLLAFDGQVRGPGPAGDPAQLRLPHPRLQDRAFVLFPLREIAPQWVHPVSGRSVAEMIARLADGHDCAVMRESSGESPRSL